jgi:hypothetical protein
MPIVGEAISVLSILGAVNHFCDSCPKSKIMLVMVFSKETSLLMTVP